MSIDSAQSRFIFHRLSTMGNSSFNRRSWGGDPHFVVVFLKEHKGDGTGHEGQDRGFKGNT